MMLGKKLAVFLLLILTIPGMAYAIGRGPGARAAAMGGAYSAIAEGIEAIAWNPAGLYSKQSFSSMLSVGGNSTMSLQEVQNLFNKLKTGQGRTDYVVENILKEIKIISELQVPLGMAVGNFGFAALGSGFLMANKAQNDFDFILLGAYQLDYGVAYGDSFGKAYDILKDLYWGATVRGFSGEVRLLYYTPNVYIVDSQIKTVAVEGSGTVSNGVAGDMGLKYKIGNVFSIALAAKDLASSYSLKRNYNYREVDFTKQTLGGIVGTDESISSDTVKSRWTLGLAYKLEELGLLLTSDINYYPTTSILLSDPQFGQEKFVTDWCFGLEKEIFNGWFARAGLSSENVAGIQESWLTYGLGIKLGGFRLDLAAGNSSRQTWQAYVETGLAF